MIISAAILSKEGTMFISNLMPNQLQDDISKHASNFLYALKIADEEIDYPYIETSSLRYIYKETGDLYWLLVTKPDSEMFTDIHLLGKFVCTIMEYGPTDGTNSSTLTDEQCDLFYRHLWRPWDDDTQCPFCCCLCNHSAEFWEREFDNRLQFLISIRDGRVEDEDVSYFNGLIAESWAISARLSPKWGRSNLLNDELTNGNSNNNNHDEEEDDGSECSSELKENSIGEETLIDCCKMKCRLEDLRLEANRIQDPYLRLFAKRNLLIGTCYNNNQTICSAPAFKELDSNGHDIDLTSEMIE